MSSLWIVGDVFVEMLVNCIVLWEGFAFCDLFCFTPLSAVTMMWSLPFLRFSSAKYSALVMFICIGLLVFMLKILLTLWQTPTAVNIIECTCLETCHISSGDVFFDSNSCWGNWKFWAFCSKDFSSGVSSFLERLITHLSWILDK